MKSRRPNPNIGPFHGKANANCELVLANFKGIINIICLLLVLHVLSYVVSCSKLVVAACKCYDISVTVIGIGSDYIHWR